MPVLLERAVRSYGMARLVAEQGARADDAPDTRDVSAADLSLTGPQLSSQSLVGVP